MNIDQYAAHKKEYQTVLYKGTVSDIRPFLEQNVVPLFNVLPLNELCHTQCSEKLTLFARYNSCLWLEQKFLTALAHSYAKENNVTQLTEHLGKYREHVNLSYLEQNFVKYSVEVINLVSSKNAQKISVDRFNHDLYSLPNISTLTPEKFSLLIEGVKPNSPCFTDLKQLFVIVLDEKQHAERLFDITKLHFQSYLMKAHRGKHGVVSKSHFQVLLGELMLRPSEHASKCVFKYKDDEVVLPQAIIYNSIIKNSLFMTDIKYEPVKQFYQTFSEPVHFSVLALLSNNEPLKKLLMDKMRDDNVYKQILEKKLTNFEIKISTAYQRLNNYSSQYITGLSYEKFDEKMRAIDKKLLEAAIPVNADVKKPTMKL